MIYYYGDIQKLLSHSNDKYPYSMLLSWHGTDDELTSFDDHESATFQFLSSNGIDHDLCPFKLIYTY